MDVGTIHKQGYAYLMSQKLAGKWPQAADRTHSERYSQLIAAVEDAKKRGDVAELKARFSTLIDFISDGRGHAPWEPVCPPQALGQAQDAWMAEVALVCAQFEATPWAKHLTKARRLAETGAVEDMTDAWDLWLVHGDHGDYQMDATELVCNCPYGTHKHEPCAHRTAVEIVKRCIAGGVQQPPVAREETVMETTTDDTPTATEETVLLDDKEFVMPKTAAGDPSPVVSPPLPAPPANVYQAMARVAARVLDAGGVAKTRTMQGSRPYRGIDDLMTALAPFMAAEGLLVLPQTNSVDLSEAKNGQQAVVHMEFTAVHAPSGTKDSRLMVGEGQDPTDKAILKAQAYAFKQYLQYAFFIPVEGMEADNDRETLPPATRRDVPDMTQGRPPAPAENLEQRIRALMHDAGKSAQEADEYLAGLKKAHARDEYARRLPGIYDRMKSKLAAAEVPKAEAREHA